jgi:hypothetical protein
MDVIRILNNDFNRAVVWSTRHKSSPNFRLLKQKIKLFLINLSGNDLISMLNDVLEENEVAELNYAHIHIQALRHISLAVNQKTKPKDKHFFIRPLRVGGLSRNQAKGLGFNLSDKIWKSCLIRNDRNLGGRPSIPNGFVKELNIHLQKLSNVSSTRSVLIRKFAPRNPFVLFKKIKIDQSRETVQNRQATLNEAFRLFKKEQPANDNFRMFRERLSYSTYCKKNRKKF